VRATHRCSTKIKSVCRYPAYIICTSLTPILGGISNRRISPKFKKKEECRRQLQIPGPRKVTWLQFRTDAHKFWCDLWISHWPRSVSGRCTWVILWALDVGGAVQNLDVRATDAKDLCSLTKTACTTVPGAGEDFHIYIRCATRIFRRGGAHSDAIYNLYLILEITS